MFGRHKKSLTDTHITGLELSIESLKSTVSTSRVRKGRTINFRVNYRDKRATVILAVKLFCLITGEAGLSAVTDYSLKCAKALLASAIL